MKPEEMSPEAFKKLDEMCDAVFELEARLLSLINLQTREKHYEGKIETPVVNTYETSHRILRYSFKKTMRSKWDHLDYGYIDNLTGEYIPGEYNALANAANLFRVEYKLIDSSPEPGLGWETNDKLKEVSAKSAREAVKTSVNMGAPQNAKYRVFEIAYNNSGELETIGGAMMFYSDEINDMCNN